MVPKTPQFWKLYTCKNKCWKYSEHELSQDPFSNVKDDFMEAVGFIPVTELGVGGIVSPQGFLDDY